MHRVELKDRKKGIFIMIASQFLMHRVELKARVKSLPKTTLCSSFLMHRVELKEI